MHSQFVVGFLFFCSEAINIDSFAAAGSLFFAELFFSESILRFLGMTVSGNIMFDAYNK